MNTETVVVPVGLIVALAKYLGRLPHDEVEGLVAGLRLIRPAPAPEVPTDG